MNLPNKFTLHRVRLFDDRESYATRDGEAVAGWLPFNDPTTGRSGVELLIITTEVWPIPVEKPELRN